MNRYTSIFENIDDTEFEEILKKSKFKYTKTKEGKGCLIIKENIRPTKRILDDPEEFFKGMTNKEFIKMLNEMEINYELKDGVNIENK